MSQFDNALFASQMGELYKNIADQRNIFLQANIGNMSQDDANAYSADTDKIIGFSNKFIDLSDKIAFAGSDDCFTQIQKDTKDIDADIKKIASINKWVTVATGVISLAESILTANPGGALTSVKSVISALKN